MLRTRLFIGFAALALVVSALAAVLGVRMIRTRVVEEAQTRVTLDLSSAWAVVRFKQERIGTILELVAHKKLIVDACSGKQWESAEVQSRLALTRADFGLDFMGLVAPDGRVVMRAAAPYRTGDYRSADPAVAKALRGESALGMELLSPADLAAEADGLVERALLELTETPRSRPRAKSEEARGMVMIGAEPVREGGVVLGVVYGGVLMNRNADLVDSIRGIVFRGAEHGGPSIGTVTAFLDDCRIATTVRLKNGNRALGTQASKEVADRVLDNGGSWVGRAFVVNDWYLTAYEPIRDIGGRVIGMLYVGILERPFREMGRTLLNRYAGLMVFALAAALALAFVISGRLSDPIHRLAVAMQQMRQGQRPPPVPVRASCSEAESLVVAFNAMSEALADREASLTEANGKLERANASLTGLNTSYMETLGFVSHELKSPLATMMNYVYLLKGERIGSLTDKQRKAVTVLDATLKRLVEMARHYLNLSRIESGEWQPRLGRVAVSEDVLRPILEAAQPEVDARGMRVDNRVGGDVFLRADPHMVREIFENLMSNAIKYGRNGGAIALTASRRDGWWVFGVRNEGTGIPADRLASIFGKFSRLGSAAGDAPAGTGLGLFITRHIVEAHGGRIEARSAPGEWAEFEFTLPVDREGQQ